MSRLANLFDANGAPVQFGRKLGSGGEGAVYELSASKDAVAKVYHNQIKHEKQTKLISMVHECDESLKKISAWPTSTLHQGRNGPVCGFIMPNVAGYEPIHKLYSPAHRKQSFPKADWAFLVNTARNVAAAFEAIHVHGHAIADVNYGNVVVAGNSLVKLIDCDSFQITCKGKPYLCEVGVAHFTPPELQALQTFHGANRTENHDNFGLALLCFHLLFMGRHPFSGVYSGHEDMPLEKAIAQLRFAFGRNASAKGMKPPPNSIGLEIVTQQVAAFFEEAFSEAASKGGRRPKAREWVQALEQLKTQLRACPTEPVHKYFGGLSSCPWCALEQRSGNLFFIRVVFAQPVGGPFDLNRVWSIILSVAPPGNAPTIDLNSFKATPKPLPKSLRDAKRNQVIKRILSVAMVIGTFALNPSGGVYLIVFIVACVLFFSKVNDSAEKKARGSARDLAESKWQEAERRWKRDGGDGLFQSRVQELKNLKSRYENLNSEYAKEKQGLQSAVRQRQLHKFLDGFFIEGHKIQGIGPGRKAALASFGIETAADIDHHKIIQISGFGEGLTRELTNWRSSLERKFVFDPSKGIDRADIDALNQKFNKLKAELQSALLAGQETLNRAKNDTLMRRQALRTDVEAAGQAYINAIADASIFK
jgi:DNA-binding helix-hairpin-helix protein with protein kinase domain